MYSHVACDVMKERTLLSAKAEFIDMALNAISFLVMSNYAYVYGISRRGAVDKPLALYPGVLSSFPCTPNLSDETL